MGLTHGGYDSGHSEHPETSNERRDRLRRATATYNARTAKLAPTGDAYRDKLVAARLNIRREAR